MSRATALLTGVLVSGSIAIAAGGIHVGHRALEQTAVFSARCEALAAENAALKEQLSAALAALPEVTERRTVITVEGSEFSPRTVALKNRNYLNVKSDPANPWQGQIGTDRQGHAIFESPAWSIRAGAITLRTYEKKHGIKTVHDLVHRFAEGNRQAYIAHVCKALGVKPKEEFSFSERMPELLRAMVKFETGQQLGAEYLALLP